MNPQKRHLSRSGIVRVIDFSPQLKKLANQADMQKQVRTEKGNIFATADFSIRFGNNHLPEPALGDYFGDAWDHKHHLTEQPQRKQWTMSAAGKLHG